MKDKNFTVPKEQWVDPLGGDKIPRPTDEDPPTPPDGKRELTMDVSDIYEIENSSEMPIKKPVDEDPPTPPDGKKGLNIENKESSMDLTNDIKTPRPSDDDPPTPPDE